MDKLFGDEPLAKGDVDADELGLVGFAGRTASLLERMRVDDSSNVVALVGPWGSGKTSALNFTVEALPGGEHGWLIAEFNPWLFSDVESLLLGFFKSLDSLMPDDDSWGPTRRNLGEFVQAVSPLGKLSALAGFDSAPILQAAGRRIAGTSNSATAKHALEKSLRKLGRPILVVLDDLDRLEPAELMLTLKLVRLLGRLPNIYYLMAYDEETLLDALGRTDLVQDDHQRALEYLEKIVQVRLDIPPLREGQVIKFFNEGVEKLIARHESISLSEDDFGRLSEAFWKHLVHKLTTPRTIKRLFTQLETTADLAAADELDFVDLFLITYVRTSHPVLYRALYDARNRLLNRISLFQPSAPDASKAKDGWLVLLEKSHVTDRDRGGLLDLLAVMFLPIRRAVAGHDATQGEYDSIAARRGIGHRDYFERYFAHGVPAEDIADSTVRQAVMDLRDGQMTDAVRALAAVLNGEPAKALRKMESQADAAAVGKGPLLGLVGALYDAMPGGSVFDFGGKRAAEQFAETWLGALSKEDGVSALGQMIATFSGLQLASRAVARLLNDNNDISFGSWAAEARALMDQAIGTALDERRDQPIEALGSQDPFVLLWMWWHIAPKAATAWVRGQVDSGRWSTLDFLAAQVPIAYGSSGAVLSDIDFSSVAKWYPLSQLHEALEDEINALPDSIDTWDVKPTWEGRRNVALKRLRDWGANNSQEPTGQDADESGSSTPVDG